MKHHGLVLVSVKLLHEVVLMLLQRRNMMNIITLKCRPNSRWKRWRTLLEIHANKGSSSFRCFRLIRSFSSSIHISLSCPRRNTLPICVDAIHSFKSSRSSAIGRSISISWRCCSNAVSITLLCLNQAIV